MVFDKLDEGKFGRLADFGLSLPVQVRSVRHSVSYGTRGALLKQFEDQTVYSDRMQVLPSPQRGSIFS